jgi:hypothetical protein
MKARSWTIARIAAQGWRLNQWADISHCGTASRIVADSVHSLRTGTPETSHDAHITVSVLDLGEFVLSGSSKSPRSGSSRPAMPAKRLFFPRRWCSCGFWRRTAFPVLLTSRTPGSAQSERPSVRGQHAWRCVVSTRGGAWSARVAVCGQHAWRCALSTCGGVRSARVAVCAQHAWRCALSTRGGVKAGRARRASRGMPTRAQWRNSRNSKLCKIVEKAPPNCRPAPATPRSRRPAQPPPSRRSATFGAPALGKIAPVGADSDRERCLDLGGDCHGRQEDAESDRVAAAAHQRPAAGEQQAVGGGDPQVQRQAGRAARSGAGRPGRERAGSVRGQDEARPARRPRVRHVPISIERASGDPRGIS